VSGLAGRAALAVLAAAAVVPLAIWLGAASSYEGALDEVERAGGSLSAQQAGQIARDLRSAADRTPSTEPEVALAQLDLFTGRPRPAAAELRGVLEREPENATAWGLLAIALREDDPDGSRRAARRERELRAGFARRN